MRRMALMMGNILPFGITRDMKNVFLLMDYWQQATRTDMESFMHLILRQYGGRKFLPRKAVYHGIRNLSERSFFSGNLR